MAKVSKKTGTGKSSAAKGSANKDFVSEESRAHLRDHLAHVCHMLSEQGPMSITFVHNNTLLGLQDQHFEAAIDKAEAFLGGCGFLSNEQFRDYYSRNRITDSDIAVALSMRKNLEPGRSVLKTGDIKVTEGDVLLLAMTKGIEPVDPTVLGFRALEEGATAHLDNDLSAANRAILEKSATTARDAALQLIGVNMTFSGWLDSVLGDGLEDAALTHVVQAIANDTAPNVDSETSLSALGIAAERRADYLALVAARITSKNSGATDNAVAHFVEAEMRLIEDFASSRLAAPGRLNEILTCISEDPSAWSARTLWSAAVAACGIADPFRPEVQGNEATAHLVDEMEAMGGPALPVDKKLRDDISALVDAELKALETETGDNQIRNEGAHLCWTILYDLGADRIGRRGYEALLSLVSTAVIGSAKAKKIAAALGQNDPRRQMLGAAEDMLAKDIKDLAGTQSHANFKEALTGETIIKPVNDYMITLTAAFLDEGLAAWHMPSRALGFYAAWRQNSRHDISFNFDGVGDWHGGVEAMPVLAADAVISELVALGVDEHDWPNYCGRILTELKGWAGMVFWRQVNPDYSRQKMQPIDILQYLAVRLRYENLLLARVCSETWAVELSTEALNAHFTANLPEFYVRRRLHAGTLSEQLASEARTLIAERWHRGALDSWMGLADRAWLDDTANKASQTAALDAWRLFRLAQHLGLDDAALRGLSEKEVAALMGALDVLPPEKQGPVWLLAFEKNYRDEVLNAMALNRGKGRWLKRGTRPKSQVVLCIDEREESIHRHYEELDPGHETLGVAGFFGVAMDFEALDDHHTTPLCPAPVTPAHRVEEMARTADADFVLPVHKSRSKWLEVFHDVYWDIKRNPVASYFLIDVVGFLNALPLLGRIFAPLPWDAINDRLHRAFVPDVSTELAVTRPEGSIGGLGGVSGFTDVEQADRIEGLLRNIGLLEQFAPIVVMCAHGSSSLNNPHENAHDCGACGGKNGAPNSRVVAAMANRQEVRRILRERGIIIPDDCWFVGAIHNTATELISLADEQDVPDALRPQYDAVKRDLDEAVRRAARERCRRFGSAPKDASLDASLRHTRERAADISQVRPEWGHATNACAIVGRRALTQGVFFDRRSFIISYDPATDPSGEVLERILLAVGPVGAGINLEYYFSTVDPKVFGADTKVPHNVTGLVGVMEGAHSDLRTGLPRQMTEVHEAMRLHLIVDAPPAIAGEIYGRQPAIQQLLDNEWVLLIVHDPATGEFLRFVPGVGFEKWDDSNLQDMPEVSDSYAWFKGKHECFLPPARITEPETAWIS